MAGFKLDENMPEVVVTLLRWHGHDASTVRMQGLQGSDDERIAGACHAEGRILITLDKDFANARDRPPHDMPGVIVLRPRFQGALSVLNLMEGVIPQASESTLAGRLWVVSDSGIRVYPERRR